MGTAGNDFGMERCIVEGKSGGSIGDEDEPKGPNQAHVLPPSSSSSLRLVV